MTWLVNAPMEGEGVPSSPTLLIGARTQPEKEIKGGHYRTQVTDRRDLVGDVRKNSVLLNKLCSFKQLPLFFLSNDLQRLFQI